MSVLTDRLRALGITGIRPAREIEPWPDPKEPIAQALGGDWSADRRSFVVERRLDAHAMHGRVRIGDIASRIARAAQSRAASMLTHQLDACPPFLFFDLETTGLSGGAGTYAFLVGTSRFDKDDFLIRQHLLIDYASEPAMLRRVADDFACAASLVSFNGKSFDAPLLDTRYSFHRQQWPGAGRPHVDALHPSRRFWRQGATGPRESCSLIALEEELLGVRRVGDVPGFEIPARYFHFVRSGDAAGLAPVLEHNRLDLISLAALTARLFELVEEGASCARDSWEAVALGRTYAANGCVDRACDAFERAIDMSAGGSVAADTARVEALRGLAALLRRARRYDDAADAWRRLLQVRTCPHAMAREANEALAIHHEHRVRDLAAAKMFALNSLETGAGRSGAAWNDAVRHRLERLEKKERRTDARLTARPLFPSSSLPPSCGSPTSAPRTSS